MQVDISFVHFPKSHLVRQMVAQKLSECADKFSNQEAHIKAFFSADGFEHHVKILFQAGRLNTFVNASANDIAHAIDKAISKLSTILRKNLAKRKHKKMSLPPDMAAESNYNMTNLRQQKRRYEKTENVFDKYENQYVHDFEDHEPKRA